MEKSESIGTSLHVTTETHGLLLAAFLLVSIKEKRIPRNERVDRKLLRELKVTDSNKHNIGN